MLELRPLYVLTIVRNMLGRKLTANGTNTVKMGGAVCWGEPLLLQIPHPLTLHHMTVCVVSGVP